LAGATLLVLANKQDLPGALSYEEIRDVGTFMFGKLSKSALQSCDGKDTCIFNFLYLYFFNLGNGS